MKAHAKLSASASKRWLMCTPSAVFESKFPASTSAAADEGTLAHDLGELMIRNKSGRVSDLAFSDCLRNFKLHKYYSEDMFGFCDEYSDFVIAQFEKAKLITPDAVLEVEQRLDFSKWVAEGFGTGDAIVIADSVMYVIDLKYGANVRVECKENTQMMCYALGALEKYAGLYDIERVEMTIYQPRMENVSTWGIDVENLLFWADNFLQPKAELAFEGKGDFGCGEWCQFCRAKPRCKTFADSFEDVGIYQFKEPESLTDDAILTIFERAPAFIKWINSITEYVSDQALNQGKEWEGYKLVAGRSTRQFTDYALVVETLVKNGFQEDELYEQKPLGITAAEKLVGKKRFEPLLAEYLVKPEGKPTLVKSDDPRPTIGAKETANEVFKDIEI